MKFHCINTQKKYTLKILNTISKLNQYFVEIEIFILKILKHTIMYKIGHVHIKQDEVL